MSNINFTPDEELAWKNAGRKNFDDGEYSGELINAYCLLVGQDQRKKLCLEYDIKTPSELSGSTYKHFFPLDIDKIMWFVKKQLSLLGIDLTDVPLSELENVLQSKFGILVKFFLRTDGKYQNAEIIGALSGSKKDNLPDFDKGDIQF